MLGITPELNKNKHRNLLGLFVQSGSRARGPYQPIVYQRYASGLKTLNLESSYVCLVFSHKWVLKNSS